MTRPPTAVLVALGVILALAAVMVLTWLGIPPFDNLFLFILSNVVSFFAILALGVLGGAFLGMILMHRFVQNREFTPLEQTMLHAITEVRDATHRLERMEGELLNRLEKLEEQMARR